MLSPRANHPMLFDYPSFVRVAFVGNSPFNLQVELAVLPTSLLASLSPFDKVRVEAALSTARL
jgi:hypothetical protein